MNEPVPVVVWGTGNVGRAALRAVLAHRDLELVGVVAHTPAKIGRDAGELADVAAVGVAATDDVDAVLARRPGAVVYAASGDLRPDDALTDVCRCLEAGADVTTTSIYSLLHPATVPDDVRARVEAACETGGSSVYCSGIDPGWAQDLLPLLLSGVTGRIDQIGIQELFDYSTYDAPEIVRDVIGFGHPLDHPAPMLLPSVPTMIWGPMIRILADAFEVDLDDITETVERRPLETDVETVQGRFEAGSQGSFRLEVTGVVGGEPRFVIDHVTRITPAIAPDWPAPAGGKVGEHRVIIEGRPRLEVAIHATDGSDNPADGGNATAAGRIVNVIPALAVRSQPGIVGTLDLPLVIGGGLA